MNYLILEEGDLMGKYYVILNKIGDVLWL